MNDALVHWCEEALIRVRAISAHARAIYADTARLPHYRDVAQRLYELHGDEALTRAGFLHGINAHVLAHELRDWLDEETEIILRGRDRLASLDVRSRTDRQQLETNVLPSLPDSRSANLFIIEQLLHADPGLRFERWVAAFHAEPSSLPPGVPEGPLHTSPRRHHGGADYALFLRSVVAPTAAYFGMWHEKDVAEDASFLLESPERFAAMAAFARAMSDSGGPCEQRVALVAAALEEESGVVSWEWRHVASMSRWLPRTSWEPHRPAGDWIANLSQCGFVTVICPDEAECYSSLRLLHRAREHRDGGFRDTLAHSARSGYRALHTEVVVDGVMLAVRLIPADANARRFQFLRGSGGRPAPSSATGPMLELQVFAPDGRAVLLPLGSTVLNYAHKIHNALPARVRAAQVNGEEVGLLHPLSLGDVVFLDIGKEARPLPVHWEKRVPAETVAHIRKSHRAAIRTAMVARGRRWLRDYLAGVGTGTILDDEGLDRVVEGVDEHFHRRGGLHQIRGKDWWFLQLGLHAAALNGEMPSGRLGQNTVLRNHFLNAAAKEATLRGAVAEMHLRDGAVRPRFCGMCRPSLADPCVVSLQDGILFVHRVHAPCIRGDAVPLERHLPEPQYMVILGNDRAGLAAEVLGVFQRSQVGIERLEGLRLNQGSGMIRVRLDVTPMHQVHEIIETLQQVPGVQRIHGPKDPSPSQETDYLPPRRRGPGGGLPQGQDPFVCGPEVLDDELFYGMDAVLARLKGILGRVVSPSSPTGGHVFVHGPKRAGKTSVVRRFLNNLAMGQSQDVIPVYKCAREGESWSKFEADMIDEVVRVVRDRAASIGVPLALDVTPDTSLSHVVMAVRRQMGCDVVLAIDEAVFLLNSTRTMRERRRLAEFTSHMRGMQGVLCIWVGPTAFRHAPDALQVVLQSAPKLPIARLSDTEVRSLLRTEKFGLRYAIHVEDVVAAQVYALTAGNPYWVGWLAAEMWHRAPRHPDETVSFDDALLQQAITLMVDDSTPFIDRYKPEKDRYKPEKKASLAARQLMGAVLLVFARVGAAPRRDDDAGVSESRLWDELRRLLPTVPAEDLLRDVLGDLIERGAIEVLPEKTGERGWAISAPLLARHILTISRQNPGWLLTT